MNILSGFLYTLSLFLSILGVCALAWARARIVNDIAAAVFDGSFLLVTAGLAAFAARAAAKAGRP